MTGSSEDGEEVAVYGGGFGPDTGGILTILPDGTAYGPADPGSVARVWHIDVALLARFDASVGGWLARALRQTADQLDDSAAGEANRRLADRLQSGRARRIALAS